MKNKKQEDEKFRKRFIELILLMFFIVGIHYNLQSTNFRLWLFSAILVSIGIYGWVIRK